MTKDGRNWICQPRHSRDVIYHRPTKKIVFELEESQLRFSDRSEPNDPGR